MNKLEMSGIINMRYRIVKIREKHARTSRYFIVDYADPRKLYNYSFGLIFVKNSFKAWEISEDDLQDIKLEKTGESLGEIKLQDGSLSYYDNSREKMNKKGLKYKFLTPMTKDKEYLYWIAPVIVLPLADTFFPYLEISGLVSWILFAVLLILTAKMIFSFIKRAPSIVTTSYKEIIIKQKFHKKKVVWAPFIILLQALFAYILIHTIFIEFSVFPYLLFMCGLFLFTFLKFAGTINEEATIEIIEN